MQDFRFALRTLRKQPVFTAVAVLTLALGIGANTAIFSFVYHLLFRPLPYHHAERLVFVWNSYPKGGSEPSRVSIPDYLDRKASAPALEDATLFTPKSATISIGGTPEQLVALAVTPSFFSTLGRTPRLGRSFAETDAASGADRVVIVTDGFWRSRLGAEASAVGHDIRLGGEPHRIVGVLPPDFELPWPKATMLVPFSFTDAQRSDAERGNEFSLMIGRLHEGASIAQLNAEMRTIVDHLMERVPGRAAYMRNSGFTGIAIGMRDQLAGDSRRSLYLLQASVILVLLIACANVANLLLMRAAERGRELAIRATLGATRWRLVKQLAVEGAALSALGAAAGAATAAAAMRVVATITAEQWPEMTGATIAPAVLIFTLALGVLTSIVFGVVPAISVVRGDVASRLKDDSARGSAGARTGAVRNALIVAETALAVVLLVGAGLLLKSFAKLTRVDPGFAVDHVLTAQISLPPTRYRDPGAQRAFWQRLLERSRQIPGATAVGLISTVPFSGDLSSGSYTVVGHAQDTTAKPPHARQDQVDGDYFRAMGIPLLDGRLFRDTDAPDRPRVVVIDRFLANRQFAGASAVGRQLNFGGPRNYTIVGVVGTINDADLSQPVPEERIYFSGRQLPIADMRLVVKAAMEPTTLASQVAASVRAIDPEQPVSEVRTMEQWLSRSLGGRRTPTMLLTLFGVVALVLSAIGIYGVVASGVAQRTREFGIRRALGATRASILSLVFAQGLRTAGGGIVIGIAAAAGLTRYLQSLLFGVEPHDLVVFGAVVAALLVVGGAACYLPARRATRVPPLVALRDI
jgi:predicted permease